METYHVRRGDKVELVRFVREALTGSGFQIECEPDPGIAPFVFSVIAPWGAPIELICYAFYANEYRQRNRPSDEHRFQIKYGSDFHRAHAIHIPTEPHRLTLMFGVHLDAGIVVAVDPTIYNPTWFSRSIYFRTEHIERVQHTGWTGWEREQRDSHRALPDRGFANLQTEAMLGLRPERFADYVLLEQQTTGVPPGERLLAIEERIFGADEQHVVERLLGLPAAEILDGVNARSRLLVAIRGAAAEIHLNRLLHSEPEIDRVQELDVDGEPDFEVGFQGRRFRIECKNSARTLTRSLPKVDFQKTRAAIGNPCSRYYRPEQFDVLAACLHPISMRWEFRFVPTRLLPAHPTCAGHLSQHVLVDDDRWTTSIVEALEAAGRLGPE